ncbi:hypothetical protein B484DRAFT_56177, partial [Ochromonadaceae sp. CCMP2298]
MQTILALVVVAALSCNAFTLVPHNARVITRSQLSMAASSPEFSALEAKLKVRTDQSQKAAPGVKKSAPAPSPTSAPAKYTAPLVAKAPAAPVKVASAPVKTEVKYTAPVKVTAAPVAVKSVEPSAPAGSEVVPLGVGLGLAPYLLIPLLAFPALKGLLKPPKPLPVVVKKVPKVAPYSKSLAEGLKEGLADLQSGKSTPDLDLTRKSIKLSLGGFGIAAVLAGALVATSPGPKTITPPAVKVAAKAVEKAAPAAAVVAAPAPAPVAAPAPKVVEKPAPAPVAVPVPVAAPAPAPKVVEKPAPAPVAAPAPAPKVIEKAPAP